VQLKNCNRLNRGFQDHRTHDDLEALFLVATAKWLWRDQTNWNLEKRMKDRGCINLFEIIILFDIRGSCVKVLRQKREG
jgi:hypothetical protein